MPFGLFKKPFVQDLTKIREDEIRMTKVSLQNSFDEVELLRVRSFFFIMIIFCYLFVNLRCFLVLSNLNTENYFQIKIIICTYCIIKEP